MSFLCIRHPFVARSRLAETRPDPIQGERERRRRKKRRESKVTDLPSRRGKFSWSFRQLCHLTLPPAACLSALRVEYVCVCLSYIPPPLPVSTKTVLPRPRKKTAPSFDPPPPFDFDQVKCGPRKISLAATVKTKFIRIHFSL